ncbi:response regulator transcription factor [Paraconexibacter antarcticus]|uniref:Response regulator transcription factor n=1 Tax=Paraconexibacter antarcticus TaxID=2949664 RepID=A0ABY5DV59_9ACTN|nr:response regulator transcription factor [Paraconexibacter antarcticus]UTI65903.1 response regulator transcription factor [Paraconexibacter antarcticus]
MHAEQHTRDVIVPVTAVLADCYSFFRMGLARALTAMGVAVVGEATDGTEAVRLAAELRPDVVVMDPDLPILDGIGATRQITAMTHPPAILILADEHSTAVLDALLAGATGFLLKDADITDLVSGIRNAAVGECALAPRVAGALVERLRQLERSHASAARCADELTSRERQVLSLVAQGRDNAAIGQALCISSSTAKHHVGAILDKLGASNRAQAAADAVRFGLV